MDYRDVLKVRSKIVEELKARGNPIHPRLFKLLQHKYSGGYFKVWEAMLNDRVKKYVFQPSGRTLWIVVGREAEYIIYPEVGFCSCDAFYFFVLGKKTKICYHVVAQAIAEALGWYDQIEERDIFFEVLMKDWRVLSSRKCSAEVNSNRDDDRARES